MERAHHTVESQLRLRKQGIAGIALILIVLGGWLVFQMLQADAGGAAAPVDSQESGLHEAGEHGASSHAADSHADDAHEVHVPAWYSVVPFVALLGCIAVLPLFRKTEHWWEKNSNRFLVAAGLGVLTLAYYAFFYGHGVHDHMTHGTSSAGFAAAGTVLKNAMLAEYIPFITLLFCLYVISGGIVVEGRLAGKPHVNTAIIGLGAMIASFVGTTGAAMLLIRPLLSANVKRKYVAHSVVFFIFAVCNTGGCLLPIGDPPLFLGYLRGVDFFWTLKLWPEWLFVNLMLLLVYFVFDLVVSRREEKSAFEPAQTTGPLISLQGKINFVWLLAVIGCVATLDPSKPVPGTNWHAPLYFREFMMFLLALASILSTSSQTRLKNTFNYDAILEVAALFTGIFICMQAPVQILNVYGKDLGIDSAVLFFWATGGLSAFLDNAPTYVVFFETAKTMVEVEGTRVAGVPETFLVAISLGSVFMGAMTYIGNGPNFMVKAIAEKNNVRMPSFFGYMVYSVAILLPILLLMTFLFL